jgi:hypothetical protein
MQEVPLGVVVREANELCPDLHSGVAIIMEFVQDVPDEFREDVAGVEDGGCVAGLFLDESPRLRLFPADAADLSLRQQRNACDGLNEIAFLLEHASGLWHTEPALLGCLFGGGDAEGAEVGSDMDCWLMGDHIAVLYGGVVTKGRSSQQSSTTLCSTPLGIPFIQECSCVLRR